MSIVERSEQKRLAIQPGSGVRTGFPALAAGASVIMAGLIASRLLEFVARTALGRYLGPDDFGLLATGMALLSIISTFILLGLPSGIVHFVGRYKSDGQAQRIPHLLAGVFGLVAVLACLAAILLWQANDWLASSLLNNSELGPVLRYVALALPLAALLGIMTAVFQAEKDARSHALIKSFLLPGMRLFFVALAVVLGWRLQAILPLYFVGALLLPVLVTAYLLWKRSVVLPPQGRVEGSDLSPIIRYSLPLLAGSLFGLMVWQVDLLLMQREWGAAETGLYAAALTIGRLPNMLLLAFGFMLAPFVAQQYSSGHLGQTRRMYGRVVDMVFMLGLPVAAIFALFSPLILEVLFGAAYVEAAWVLRILAIGFFVHSIAGPNGTTLAMMGHSRLFLVDTAIGAAITALLYVMLIPSFGSIGAAIGTISGLIILNVIYFFQLYRLARINPMQWMRFALFVPLTIAAVLALILAGSMPVAVPDWLLLALVSVTLLAVYIVFTLLFRIVSPKELRLTRQILTGHPGHRQLG